jgi:hypothetical protein
MFLYLPSWDLADFRDCVSLVVPLQTLGFTYSTEVDERNFQHKFPVSLLKYLMQPHGV